METKFHNEEIYDGCRIRIEELKVFKTAGARLSNSPQVWYRAKIENVDLEPVFFDPDQLVDISKKLIDDFAGGSGRS